MAAALDPIISVLEASDLTMLSLAISGSATLAFERHGLRQLLNRIGDLASERRLELVSTAAHSGLLPLMPEREVIRQIELNDSLNRMCFGDGYTPACLWPPMLAISPKVVRIAAHLEFPSLLVDEAAMRVWPAAWTGERIDFVENMAGLFLLPRSRRATRAFDTGQIRQRHDLDRYAPGGDPYAKTYLITADELSPRSSGYRALLATMDQEPTLTLERLFNHFPLSHGTSPLPCSALSTPEELGTGLPFAPWFEPGNEQHALQWRLMSKVSDALHELERRELTALPQYQLLRDVVDRGWRESWWRSETTAGVSRIGLQVAQLRGAFEPLREQIPESLQRDVTELIDHVSQGVVTTTAPARLEEPLTMH